MSEKKNQIKIVYIPLSKISSSRLALRESLGSLDGLKQSITKRGLLHPIYVKKTKDDTYKVKIGERRYHACKELGWKTIPTIIDSEISRLESLTENIQRKKLNPLEESIAVKRNLKEFKYLQNQMAKEIGVTEGWVSQRIAIAEMEQGIITRLSNTPTKLSFSKLRNLSRLQDKEDRFRQILEWENEHLKHSKKKPKKNDTLKNKDVKSENSNIDHENSKNIKNTSKSKSNIKQDFSTFNLIILSFNELERLIGQAEGSIKGEKKWKKLKIRAKRLLKQIKSVGIFTN